ncbi:MAG: phosphotransferase [Bacteroidia bacterium]
MDKRTTFLSHFPGKFFLDADSPGDLTAHLRSLGWLKPDEYVLSATRPGEGNMNCVLRINTGTHSFIVKQARPWVEKYPQIPAPVGRTEVEAIFFDVIGHFPSVARYTPTLIGYDGNSFLLATEDLGEGADYTFLYRKGNRLSDKELTALVTFISGLHRYAKGAMVDNFPENHEMRALNHEHIFRFPYMEENGFDLDQVQPGLQAVAMKWKTNAALKQKISTLGDVYLSKGTTLIHGDYYPGSWLKVGDEVKVIDPEFGFVGYPEFDLAVFIAQMTLAGQGETVISAILNNYDSGETVDRELVAGFAGTEIMRRLIGIAQLPLALSLEEKTLMLEKAASAIGSGKIENLF